MAHFDDIILDQAVRIEQSDISHHDDVREIFNAAGFRQVIRPFSRKLKSFSVGYVYDAQGAYQALTKVYEVVGREHSFLVRPWTDWNSTDGSFTNGFTAWTATDQKLRNQTTGLYEGDGSETVFDIVKEYVSGSGSSIRRVFKPNATGFLVAVNGVTQTVTTDYTIDTANGRVTFEAGSIPPAAEATRWGGAFYEAVRFAGPLDHGLLGFDATSFDGIVLEEERLAISP